MTTTNKSGFNRRNFLAGSAAATAALSLKSQVGFAADAGPVKIGCLSPYTGTMSRAGQSIRQGIEMALEDARAAGGIPLTIDGQKRDVELIWVDDQGDPEQAVKAVREARDRQGIEMLLGGWSSSVAMAVMEVTADTNLLWFGSVGESQYIAEKIAANPEKYKGYFKCYPSPEMQSSLYGIPLNYYREHGMWKPQNLKAAVLVEDTDFGRGWGESMAAGLSSAGYEVLPYDATPMSETDFAPILTKYKALQASVVAVVTSGSVSFANLVKQFRSQKLNALLLPHGLTWYSEWRDLAGSSADYSICMDSPQAIADWQFEWQGRFKEKFNEEPSTTSSGLAYDYARMAFATINEVGSLDFDKLVGGFRRAEYKGVWNKYAFATSAGPKALSPNEVMVGEFMEGFFFPMVQINDGTPTVIWPLKYAKAQFQSPPWLK